jgi:hypothetical protein
VWKEKEGWKAGREKLLIKKPVINANRTKDKIS